MTATTTCRFCGTEIVLGPDGAPRGVVALGDQFLHLGCVESAPGDEHPTTPAYHLPDRA